MSDVVSELERKVDGHINDSKFVMNKWYIIIVILTFVILYVTKPTFILYIDNDGKKKMDKSKLFIWWIIFSSIFVVIYHIYYVKK